MIVDSIPAYLRHRWWACADSSDLNGCSHSLRPIKYFTTYFSRRFRSFTIHLTQRWSELPPRFAVFDFILNLSCREGWLGRRHGGSRSAFVR
jgi:hypothetical protein